MKTMRRTLLAAAIAGSMLFAGIAFAQQADRSDRTTAAQTESNRPMSDTWITTKVKAALLAEDTVSGLDITVETANGTVSLSGDVDSRAQIDRATAVARDIEGVRSVDAKQLVVNTSRDRSTSTSRNDARGSGNRDTEAAAGGNGRAMNSNSDRSDRTVAANTESNQPVSDTWISTKVKADLLATSDVSGLDIGVETTNGIVSLSGDVETRAQIERAEAIASDIEGVQRVDTSQLKVGNRGNDRN